MNRNIIILIFIILNIIYNLSGLSHVILIVLWLINYIISTILLVNEPDNILMRIIQLISLFMVLCFIFLNFYSFINILVYEYK